MFETKDFKFRLDDIDDEQGTFTGFASVFGEVDSYNEVVERGAFKKTLKENNGKFPLCWFHKVDEPLGIVVARERNFGLEVNGELNLDVQSAREKRSLMKQGAIKGLSIGFKTMKDQWNDEVRHLKEIKLYEISPITLNFQACPSAEIENVKSEDMLPEEFKPYPNEHSARLRRPGDFDPDTFRRKNDGMIYGKIKVPSTAAVIWGKLKGSSDADDMPIPQAIRFPVKSWTVAEAKKWLSDNKVKYILFEAAKKSLEGVLERVLSIETADNLSQESVKLIEKSITHLQTLQSTHKPLEIGTCEFDELKPSFEVLTKSLRELEKTLGG